MAMQQMIGSSSSLVASGKFDVFISFRGEDTRRKFTSHLYEALRKRVTTFIDDSELKKGDEISSTLAKAIKESSASIVIFSKDYSSSKWCLNELIQILECKERYGQIVIPIFYEIDPSHVRYQIGSYGQAFAKHEQDLKHSKDKLQKWKNALTEAANLSGWDSQNYRIESDFIKVIVEDVLKQLKHRHPIEINTELVGIEKKYEEVKLLMEIESNDVKTLVLWGMGGIGKTTLAKDLYAKLCSQFERHCFIENVREESTRSPSVVRKKLFSKLLEVSLDVPCPETAKNTLERAKCFIVLDDVATPGQAENLKIGLGPGSRVIVTTRNMEIRSQFDEREIYEVKELSKNQSLQLFCWNAFREKHVKVGYEELSKSAIGYCSYNPLALKVLGTNLRTKSKDAWENELEKIKEIPDESIYNVLKLSFDDLDRAQRDIFLDIVCFSHLDYIYDRDYLMVLLNACNLYAVSGIEVLLHKALITCNEFNEIEMHDLLKEMGREIVKQESPKDPGRRSRLWDFEEVYHVFKHNLGTEVVEVIIFDTTDTEKLRLSSKFFKSMINLRVFQITNKKFQRSQKCNNVQLHKGLKWLSDKLRHLYWESFPLESLPSTFCAERLVQLNMTYSKLKKLWNGVQKLDNLTIIKLDNYEDLIEIPDLSRAPNLQILYLNWCVSLRQVHPSIFTAPKLKELYLSGCKTIKSLKTNIHSKSIQTLFLSYCSSLVEFSVTSEEMTCLSLSGTAIDEFPSSIWRNNKLTHLYLSNCKKLNIVGKKLSNCRGLEYLDLTKCTQINTLNMWFFLDGMRSLKELYLKGCYNLKNLPLNIQNCLMLERLDLCRKLKSLPKLPSSLQKLAAINCTYLNTNSIQRTMLQNMLNRPHINHKVYDEYFSYLPGAQVPLEFYNHTTEASIVLPPIPKSNLSYFVLCVILSKGLVVDYNSVSCIVYEHGKEVFQWDISAEIGDEKLKLISDHVLLYCWSDIDKLENGSGADHYNISFEFKHHDDDDEHYKFDDDATSTEWLWSTEGIKGCGVIPVHDTSKSKTKIEIVESQSGASL